MCANQNTTPITISISCNTSIKQWTMWSKSCFVARVTDVGQRLGNTPMPGGTTPESGPFGRIIKTEGGTGVARIRDKEERQ
jgi:hypothetical protein